MLVDFASLNGWAILAAAIAAYAIGGIWYAPGVLGARWLAALGKTKEELGSPAKPMVVQAFLTLLMALTLAVVVVRFGAISWPEGAAIGFSLSIGLVGAAHASEWMFCGFNAALFRIQAGYRVVSLTAMGAILGAWR